MLLRALCGGNLSTAVAPPCTLLLFSFFALFFPPGLSLHAWVGFLMATFAAGFVARTNPRDGAAHNHSWVSLGLVEGPRLLVCACCGFVGLGK